MLFNSIIFSGLPGSGKSTLAKKLSEVYGWEVHSNGALWRAEWKSRFPNNEVSFEDWWKSTTVEDNLAVDRKAREIFERGNIIGDVRYSVLCKDITALLVFVTADLEIRSQRAACTGKYNGMSVDKIAELLFRREQDELVMGRKEFGNDYDYRDPKHYDFVLDSGIFSLNQEIEKVRSFMN